jgi:hypothetical protein
MSITDIGSITTALGLFLLAYQVFLQRKEQKNQTITKLLEEFETPELREDMKFLYSHRPADFSLNKISEEDNKIVNNVVAHFEGLAFKIQKGVIPKEVVIELYFDWIIRCAQQTSIFIKEQRANRPESEKYRFLFDGLVKDCKLFQLKRIGKKAQAKGKSLDDLLLIEPMTIFKIGSVGERDNKSK